MTTGADPEQRKRRPAGSIGLRVSTRLRREGDPHPTTQFPWNPRVSLLYPSPTCTLRHTLSLRTRAAARWQQRPNTYLSRLNKSPDHRKVERGPAPVIPAVRVRGLVGTLRRLGWVHSSDRFGVASAGELEQCRRWRHLSTQNTKTERLSWRETMR